MAVANLDLQDLNTLLLSYERQHRDLDKRISDLTIISLNIHKTASKVDPDLIASGAYMRYDNAEADLKTAREKFKAIEDKLKYIRELINKDTSNTPFTIGQF